ncbi:15191_t:CDS:2, partial [Gigaspora rosea]
QDSLILSYILSFITKNLPCAFATLVPLYKNLGLLECETKSSQTMRHASSKLLQDCLPLYNNFFPELVQIQTHLEDFSLCEKHYNQIVVSDFLCQMLVSSNIPKNRHNNQKWQINSNNFDNRIIEKQAR